MLLYTWFNQVLVLIMFNNIFKKSHYSHLSSSQRGIIQAYLIEGKSLRFIANKIGKNSSKISKEVKNKSISQMNSLEFPAWLWKFLLRRLCCLLWRQIFQQKKMASPVGLEPTALWLTVRCSNRLSYGDTQEKKFGNYLSSRAEAKYFRRKQT